MEAVFKIKGKEFNQDVFERIKLFVQDGDFSEIVISFRPKKKANRIKKETKEEYFGKLQTAIKDAADGNVVSFTVEEFDKSNEKYSN